MNDNWSNNRRRYRIKLKLFPSLDNDKKGHELLIDKDSYHYITPREFAEKISNIITEKLLEININPKNAVVTDMTAGVGGDTLSFGKEFRKVYAIEKEGRRCRYLQNNVNVYNLKNIIIYNEDCLERVRVIEDHDVTYIDPPWGGVNYRKHKSLRLKLSNYSIEDICNNLFDMERMIKTPSLVVLKLPTNYDVKYLYETINSDKIYLYDLEKMYIFVIFNPNLNKDK